jgi:hypothetical protein
MPPGPVTAKRLWPWEAGRALGEAAMAITAVIDPEVLVLGG